MRSILREKSSDFFVILQHDKDDWYQFWCDYCNENSEFMDGYEEKYRLNSIEIKKILENFGRPFLDKIKQKNEQIKHLKQGAARSLNKNSRDLELKKEDFVIFLMGALGIEDETIIKRENKYLILIDLVSLGKNNRIDELENIVLNSAYEIRRKINEKEKDLEEI